MNVDAVTIYKVKNGWEVEYSWYEVNNKSEKDWKEEKWVFFTREEAIDKIKEVLGSLEP